jgi:hypothetical protein
VAPSPGSRESLLSPTQPLPPVALAVSFDVADFDTWKASFDPFTEQRQAAGILGHHINRGRNNPNSLTIYLPASDRAGVEAFFGAASTAERMQASGIVSQPQLMWMKPVQEDVVWDRETPSLIVSHAVADFDAWLETYNAGHDLRRGAGVIGDAANQSLDDPSVAIIFHQAESFEALEALMANPEILAVMQKAGVVSEPTVSWYVSGWGERY